MLSTAKTLIEAGSAAGVAAVATDNPDTAVVAGATYGAIMAIIKGITMIYRAIQTLRARKKETANDGK